MDLCREILLAIECQSAVFSKSEDIAVNGHEEPEIGYHLLLMQEAGLIAGNFTFAQSGLVRAAGVRLTWDGHEFLDASRNESVWAKAWKSVAGVGGAVAFEILKELLVVEGRKAVGLQ